MAPYTTAQTRAIAEFKQVTATDSKTAAKFLKSVGWEATQAINAFFNQTSSSAPASSSSKSSLNKLFDKYRDPKTGAKDSIGIAELLPYFEQIGVDLETVSSLVAQEIMKCPEMGTMSREGFVEGWSTLGCDTVDKQKKFLAERTRTLGAPANREVLKNVYKYSFELGITSQGQRLVPKDDLVEFWRLLLSPPGLDWRTKNNNWIALWLEFVESTSTKAFNRDVWTQTLRFAEASLADESLAWWNEEASWPALIDEFVEWIREKRGETGQVEDEEMDY